MIRISNEGAEVDERVAWAQRDLGVRQKMDNRDIKVLLVEDNADDAKFIQDAVAQVGDRRFCLRRVDRLEAGLEHLAQEQCDVILLDLSLSNDAGLNAVTKLHDQSPKVPIVILTNLQKEALARETVGRSAQDYLVKEQLSGNLLIRAMRNAIERQKLVTHLKQEIRELQSSQAHSRNIITKNADGMLIVDKNGIIRFANPAAEALFGHKADKLIGELFGFPIVAGETTELDIVRRGGEPVIAEMRVVQTEWERKPAYLASLRDITERKQTEERLSAQKELIDSVLASIPNIVLVIDAQFRVRLVNRAFYNVFEIKRGGVEGRSVSDVLPVEGLNEAISKTLASSEPQLDLEFTYEVDTDKRILTGQFLPMLQQEGQLLLILRDVTAERIMQEQLHYTRTLASIGEMASGVAHEINNPLTAVIGFAELLAKKDIPKDIGENINIINDEAQRVASIVKRLLTFAGQQKPERGYINVNEVIQVTLNLRKYELETENIEVATQLDCELPWTMADAGQLQQVFLNILMNAETAMKSSHGKGKLFVKTEKIKDTIRTSFSDDGPGIATENMNKIFNPFFTTKKVGEGTGLGLSICHGIVAEHNGRIYARSELGKGATFVVELPIINQAKQSELSQPADDESKNIAGARILVVDDEAAIRQYLNRLLTNEGFEVQCTDSADDALDKVKNNRYSLILLDIKMPGTSGIEMYKRLQEISHSLTRRVLFITGDVMAPDTKDFFSATKAPYISKPFSTEQLKREIGRILDHGK